MFKNTGFLLFLGVVLFLVGCAHQELDPNDPNALYKDAEEALKDEKYLIALEKFRDIKNRFPYSSRATDSELKIADTYYAQESYIEAESAYQIFKELHPTHPKADYVQFQIGMSYFMQCPENPRRDLSAAHRAIESFEALLRRFPNSDYTEKAKGRIVDSRKRLAEYENYVAEFYYDRKHFLSASYRYNALLQDFPNLGYDEKALFRLGDCYFNIQMYENSRDAFQRLLKRFPESSYRDSALAALKNIKK